MFDFARDKVTGDWLMSANVDVLGIEGADVVQQRVMTRLRIARGWMNDPTHGQLGSRLHESLRGDFARAVNEIPLYVREALAPMPDVEVVDVKVEQESINAVKVRVEYRSFDPGDVRPLASQAVSALTVQLPI